MAPKVENKKCTKCSKVLSRSGKSLECYKCNKSLHLKCSRLDKKRFLKYIQGHLEFVCQFCTDCTCFEMAVKIGLIKNVQVLQHIHILGSQQIVMKLGTVGLANHKCFLCSV